MSGGRWSGMITHHLTNAARDGDVGKMDALLEKYPWILDHENVVATAVETAVLRDHADFLDALFRHGVAVDHENELGQTALHIAAQANKFDIMKDLLARGADIARADQNGNTPLHLAVERGNCTTTDILVDRGADAGVRNKAGFSPLEIARRKRYIGLERGMITSIAKRQEQRLKQRYAQARRKPGLRP